MESLTDVSVGVYDVVTLSGSVYRLDLTSRHLRRLPDANQDFDRDLRRDGEVIELVTLIQCSVGAPMELLIDLHIPDVVVTHRSTTPVVRIAAVNATEVGMNSD